MKKDSTRPKEPRRASTVILIREEGGVLQVFLLERSGGSGSFPGNYVFPGGTVDPGDGNSELWKAHVDMDPKEVSRRLGGGLGEEEVFAFGVAAIRETTHGIWISPKDGLAGNLEGEIPLSPPTLITLHELLQYPDIRKLKKEVQSRPWGEALLPRLIPLPQGSIIVEPWDPLYHEELEIDPDKLKNSVLPLGASFSRIWYHEGVWRPLGY